MSINQDIVDNIPVQSSCASYNHVQQQISRANQFTANETEKYAAREYGTLFPDTISLQVDQLKDIQSKLNYSEKNTKIVSVAANQVMPSK